MSDENVAYGKGARVLYSFYCTPRLSDMRLADALVTIGSEPVQLQTNSLQNHALVLYSLCVIEILLVLSQLQ